MYLNELTVSVIASLLVKRRLRGSCTDDGIGRLAEKRADAARRDNDCVSREGAHFHRPQVHGADAAADTLPVEHRGEKFPVLILLHLAFGLISTHLLVERVKQLLACRRASECRAVVQGPAEAAKVEKSLRSAVEGHAHAIEQIDDPRGRITHFLDRRLVSEEVSAVNGVVKMLPGRIALTLQILGRVDAALCAH